MCVCVCVFSFDMLLHTYTYTYIHMHSHLTLMWTLAVGRGTPATAHRKKLLWQTTNTANCTCLEFITKSTSYLCFLLLLPYSVQLHHGQGCHFSMQAGIFSVIHPNSEVDCRIFNMCMWYICMRMYTHGGLWFIASSRRHPEYKIWLWRNAFNFFFF